MSSSLSEVRQIKVRPITSTVHYRGKAVDAKTVGRDLDVHAVVTGRLRQEGEALVIALELVDARDNSLVWSKQYKGSRQKILDLQDDLARDLVAKLGLRLTNEQDRRLTKRYTEDPEAYLLYREGMYHRNKYSPDGFKTAIEYFERALKRDPKYALAFADLGGCYLRLGNLHVGPQETFPKAKQYLAKALELDDTLAEVHVGLGAAYLFERDWLTADREMKRALALDPNVPSQGYYGLYLAGKGRLPEALAVFQRARELDPLAAHHTEHVARCYLWMGEYDSAIAEAKKALRLDSNFFLAAGVLGLAYSRKGMHEQATAELQKAVELSNGHPRIRGFLGYAYAVAGRREEAQKLLDELTAVSDQYAYALAIARIHAALGEKDQAFEWLQKARDERDAAVIWIKVDPTFENLRSDPQFGELMRAMGLPE